jgi:hypothetical protein
LRREIEVEDEDKEEVEVEVEGEGEVEDGRGCAAQVGGWDRRTGGNVDK